MSTTDTISAYIVDDESFNVHNLKMALERFFPSVSILGTAGNVKELRQLLREKKPDVIFLDIQMPEINGIQFLESIIERDFEVIIVTAHSTYGIDALKAGAIDYLLKPIDRKELGNALTKVREKKALLNQSSPKDEQRISIPHAKGIHVVATKEIMHIVADNNYSTITFASGPDLMVAKPIVEFERQLKTPNFFRIHKSYLINLDYLDNYTHQDGGKVVMRNGKVLLVSRRRQHGFLERLKTYSRLMR